MPTKIEGKGIREKQIEKVAHHYLDLSALFILMRALIPPQRLCPTTNIFATWVQEKYVKNRKRAGMLLEGKREYKIHSPKHD